MDAANLHESAAPWGTGELVLQNGRLTGARRPLGMPTTFIGQREDCDIRLNVDGVAPLHCMVIVTPTEIEMRDLGSASGTYLNGVRTDQASLTHGDVLNIGPFQFRLEIGRASC